MKYQTKKCKKCQKTKTLAKFAKGVDSDGYDKWCSPCRTGFCKDIDKLEIYCKENGRVFNTDLWNMCMELANDMAGVKQGKKTQEQQAINLYFSKMNLAGQAGTEKVDKTTDEYLINKYNTELQDEELALFWGKGFSNDDYAFLEFELANWKKTHKCDNQAEVTLLKEICIKVLEIRKSREDGKASVGNLLKELQDLMKTASLDPAKANMASAGKSNEAFGVWIKDIEQFRPAEWHDQQEKYKDMDGFIPYLKNYVVRPIKNFITGNRDFKIIDDNITAIEDEDV